MSKVCPEDLIGTLRSNDADGNENVKKVIGFISKTIPLHVYHSCLYKMPNFAFYGEPYYKQRRNLISLSELRYGP